LESIGNPIRSGFGPKLEIAGGVFSATISRVRVGAVEIWCAPDCG
jgi:hypothetical protein